MNSPRVQDMAKRLARHPAAWTALFILLLGCLWLDAQIWFRFPSWFHALGFLTAAPVCAYWFKRAATPIARRMILSLAYLPAWQFLTHLPLAFSAYELSAAIETTGTLGAFFIGLAWTVRWIDRETKRTQPPPEKKRHWDPRRLDAWYFGRKNHKLRQSAFTLISYTGVFSLALFLLTKVTGCAIYEAPYGGGESEQLRQTVRIQKVIKKKYVINPYSSVLFNPPPIDDVELQIHEATEHLYRIGQGKADGTGFASGTTRGKVRFIRLKYRGGDWDQGMNRGSDLNLLTEYGVRLGHPVSDRPEPMEIRRLKAFPARKSPPMVYINGQQRIDLSDSEILILREYLLEKQGMIFADNGGSSAWEGQFIGVMKKILPKIEPISVYLDHPIHRVPYPLPKLPIVAPHGRSNALGWVVNGRLAVYYHPGDIGDAWADGHSGVPHEVWESSYQLGINIIFYAHSQYSQWLENTEE